MTDGTHPWTRRISRASFFLAIAATIVAFGGMTLARYDLIGKMPGFFSLFYSTPVAALAALLGLVALFLNWRKGWPHARPALLGLIIGGFFVGALAVPVLSTSGLPAIHDATTDLDDPPSFTALSLSPDNLRGLSGEDEWRRLHAEAYGDLDTVRIAAPPAEVIARAQSLAEARGWTIADVSAEEGRLEATAYASWLKFRDDVVLRVVEDGDGSLVDMRSVSRVGISDLGENAKRIREFLDELQAG
ncbi:DUF1499 domain-containing protein [Altererythrobacter sp. MTPC7]|uniref:DUF1499 domain-containing protein n=1 Tax=Altererythrobacter sp. MTPC7 TaxID=3056567 RepID=UPI0036F1AF8C